MNILFIVADQMHRYAMGCMGTDDIITPNLDRLASEGVLFESAYTNCPICTPFRINLFSGLYTCSTGEYGNEGIIPRERRSLAKALNEGGYRTSYVGKWHIGGSGNTATSREHQGDFDIVNSYQCYNGFLDNVIFFDREGLATRHDAHRTDVTAQVAIDQLEILKSDKFALFVSFQAPHYPVQPSKRFDEMYEGVRIKRRPNSQDIDPYTRTWSPPSPWPPNDCPDYKRYGNDLDEYLRLYYALTTQVDYNVGLILDKLDQIGRTEDTIVVFTADHGDMQGSHGLKNKTLPHEESSGIPLIVRHPSGASGTRSNSTVSGIDYYPTCLDWAGLPPDTALPGHSFAEITRGRDHKEKHPIFSEMKNWKMIRKGDTKLVVEGEDLKPTMLHHLDTDPNELDNRVNEPELKEQIADLRSDIENWLKMHQGNF